MIFGRDTVKWASINDERPPNWADPEQPRHLKGRLGIT